MARAEFPKAVKVAAVKRATRGGNVFCEECGCLAKRFEIDHVIADGLTGKPVLENAKVLCSPCHKEKTALDKAHIAKAKRREADKLNVKTAPAKPIQSAPFAKSEKTKIERKRLDPRPLFEDIPQ